VFRRQIPIVLALICGPLAAHAQGISLLKPSVMGSTRGGLLLASVPSGEGGQSGASLFAGRTGTSLFAPRIMTDPETPPVAQRIVGTDVERIRYLIGIAESRRDGYNAVQHGAKVRPEKRPTEMTIREIYAWIKDTPRQPHAIGRYQFIPATLKRLVNVLGLPPDTRFTPAVQDRLGDVLLAEAGLHDFREGKLSRRAFMNNLAKIWAGLPNDTGKSHYDGYAGNKASMTWSRFEAEMSRIFPS